MMQRINALLDWLSDYLAARKGLLPILGILLVILNFIVQFFPGLGWFSTSNLLLHLGVVLAILGLMLSWAL